MSLSSTISETIGPRQTVDLQPVYRVGLIAFGVIFVATQLDAVVATYLGFLPLSVFELMLLLLAGLALVAAVSAKAAAVAPAGYPPALRAVVALCLWMVVSFALSEYLAAGLDYMVRAWAVMILLILAPVFIRRPEDMVWLLASVIAAGTMNAAIMLYESFMMVRLFSTSLAATGASFDGAIRSAGGSDLNPTTVAQMVMVSAIAALYAATRLRGLARLIGATTFFICSAAVVVVSARSAAIGLAFGCSIIVMSYYRSRLFPVLVLGCTVALAGLIVLLPEGTFGRFAALADFASDRSLFRRLTYVQIGWDVFKQFPIWGIGPGNFPAHYMDDAYRYLPGRTLNPRELHNTYLDALVEYGLVGFSLFAAIFYMAMKSAVVTAHRAVSEPLRSAAFVIAATLAALLVASFFMPHKDMRYLWLVAGLALCCRGFLASEEGQLT